MKQEPLRGNTFENRLTLGGRGCQLPDRVKNMVLISKIGKQNWQKRSGYNYRSLVETAMYRYKKIIGAGLHSRKIENQKVDSMCLRDLKQYD